MSDVACCETSEDEWKEQIQRRKHAERQKAVQEAIDAEERAREQDLDALSSEKDMAEEWGSADGPSGLVRSKAIKLTRRALAAAETADVDFWKSKVQGDDDSECCSS